MTSNGEYHGIAHVLTEANVKFYEPIGSDVTICARNLNGRVKISLGP